MDNTSKFCSHLDGQPDHLTPEHQLANYWTENLAGRPLFLSKNCELFRSDKVSRDLPHNIGPVKGFAPLENMAWVRNPATGATQPFWIGPGLRSLLEKVQDGMPVSSLDGH